MQFFEAVMLICFGLSWPISIAKALRTKVVAGKSPLFMSVILVGYTSGILFKITGKCDWVVALYAMNAVLVFIDLMLYRKYSKPARTA